MIESIIKFMTTAAAVVVAFLWGEWSLLLSVLLALVALDYITGLMAAWKEKALSSYVGMLGIAKKALIFAIVAVANLVDVVLIETGTSEEPYIMIAVVVFYIANEALSIVENAGRMEAPIPEKLGQAIRVLRGKDEKNA